MEATIPAETCEEREKAFGEDWCFIQDEAATPVGRQDRIRMIKAALQHHSTIHPPETLLYMPYNITHNTKVMLLAVQCHRAAFKIANILLGPSSHTTSMV